jgi:coproporphyrinogen III oxidase
MDVTPSIKDANEKNKFHRSLKTMCDRHNKNYYTKYKKWCDEYFYLPHRNEARGIGGIFFDYKKNNFEKDFKFVRDLGVTFQMIFNNIIENKIKKKWTLKDKEMQYIKRGRYAEFNLLYDRGTKFGLQTGGNVEGILMSLPPIAKWK